MSQKKKQVVLKVREEARIESYSLVARGEEKSSKDNEDYGGEERGW